MENVLDKEIVFTNGCFDLLHEGHVHLLMAAAKEGDRLVVALNSDASVKRIKGNTRPILNQQKRYDALIVLEYVDLVIIFEEDTPIQLIKTLKPNVIVKGSDYKLEEVVGYELVKSWGGKVVLVPLLDGISTSKIIKRRTV